MELAESNKLSYYRGYYQATDDLMNFINACDTEGMKPAEIRSAMYTWLLDAKPYGKQ